MALQHPELAKLLRMAYSAERAAALAYVGHARSVRKLDERLAIRQIELDEWQHRSSVLAIMEEHEVAISRAYEVWYWIVGHMIGCSCHLIGWFMPFYFAGRLESGNVCEYFRMMRMFDELGIQKHHESLYEMGIKEKEHEAYFLDKLRSHPLLPWFERFFAWGGTDSFNDVSLEEKYTVPESLNYCRRTH